MRSQENYTIKIMKALAYHMGLIQVADCWAAGENEGGRYVSLFNSRLNYRLCAVYEERFDGLPGFVRDNVDARLAAGDVSTDRSRVAKAGLLNECPPFGFTRYQVGGASDDDMAKWRFGDVLWGGGPSVGAASPERRPPTNGNAQPPAQRPAKSVPPLFEDSAGAAAWAAGELGWTESEAMENLRLFWIANGQPGLEQLRPMWIGEVRRLKEREAQGVPA